MDAVPYLCYDTDIRKKEGKPGKEKAMRTTFANTHIEREHSAFEHSFEGLSDMCSLRDKDGFYSDT